jgi:hypothetical protein
MIKDKIIAGWEAMDRPGADSASQSDRSILDEINMRGRRPRPT